MGEWRNRPRPISKIKENIRWVITIDESGSNELKSIEKALRKNKPTDSYRHFNVTACLMSIDEFIQNRVLIQNLKYSHWDKGCADYNKKSKRVCLHSAEIRRKKGPFDNMILEEYESFQHDLSNTLKNVSLKLFSVHVDKLEHFLKYTTPFDPYELSLTFILERISFHINREDTIIVLESRGKNEDKFLLNFLKQLIDNGSDYISKENLDFIKGIYFNGKWDKDTYLKSNWALELADLYGYPLFRYGREKGNYSGRDFKITSEKLYKYPDFIGKGFKFFP